MLDQLETLIAFALIMLLLSLIVMTVVQAVNVLLQRRGYNLLWGIDVILQQMGVTPQDASRLANEVLEHPAIASNGWLKHYFPRIAYYSVPANAIRVEELAKVLQQVLPGYVARAKVVHGWYQSTLAAAVALEYGLGIQGAFPPGLASVLRLAGDDLGKRFRTILPIPGLTDAKAGGALQAALDAVGSASLLSSLPAVVNRFRDEIKKTVAAGDLPTEDAIQKAIALIFESKRTELQQKAADLKAWYETVMDRTTERFVRWTRGVTVITSFLFCFLFQIDGTDIMTKLHADKQLRAALVAQVDPTLKQAGEVMALTSTALGSQTLREMEKELKEAGLKEKVPSDLKTRTDGEDWLNKRIQGDAQPLLAKYHEKFEKVAQKHLDDLGERRKELFKKLDGSQLQLFATSPNPVAWCIDLCDMRHFAGILMAALLLSLGAPFWFNTLKGISNLRPLLAAKVERDTEEQRDTALLPRR